jgi:hypothetical protein
LRATIADEIGHSDSTLRQETPLPGLLLPGQEISAAMRVPVPVEPGSYQVILDARRANRLTPGIEKNPESSFVLVVGSNGDWAAEGCCDASLQTVRSALVQAEKKGCLPNDYTDVTEGFAASWKRRLKRKLLGNFKHAYVDVLSRQQTAFNGHVLAALQELTECCAVLDHARRTGEGSTENREILARVLEKPGAAGNADHLLEMLEWLLDELTENRERANRCEQRLAELERLVAERGRKQDVLPAARTD